MVVTQQNQINVRPVNSIKIRNIGPYTKISDWY